MHACRIQPGEMELGLGIHGEPGASKGPLKPVDQIVAQVSRDASYGLTSSLEITPDDSTQDGVHGKQFGLPIPTWHPSCSMCA